MCILCGSTLEQYWNIKYKMKYLFSSYPLFLRTTERANGCIHNYDITYSICPNIIYAASSLSHKPAVRRASCCWIIKEYYYWFWIIAQVVKYLTGTWLYLYITSMPPVTRSFRVALHLLIINHCPTPLHPIGLSGLHSATGAKAEKFIPCHERTLPLDVAESCLWGASAGHRRPAISSLQLGWKVTHLTFSSCLRCCPHKFVRKSLLGSNKGTAHSLWHLRVWSQCPALHIPPCLPFQLTLPPRVLPRIWKKTNRHLIGSTSFRPQTLPGDDVFHLTFAMTSSLLLVSIV